MTAKDSTLDAVEAELWRLIAKIKSYRHHQTENLGEYERRGRHQHSSASSCPERAAVVRASMDLTRTLAELRRYRGLW